MTTREISDVLKVSMDTVRKAAQRVLPNKVVVHGVMTDYTEDECAKILAEIRSNSDVANQIDTSELINITVDPASTVAGIPISSEVQRTIDIYEKMSDAELLQSTLSGMHKLLSKLQTRNVSLEQENKTLKIQVGQYNGYLTAIRVQAKNPTFDAKKGWRKIWKYCKEHGLEIKKIPDEHYDHINAYPLDAWYEVYPELDLPEEE